MAVFRGKAAARAILGADRDGRELLPAGGGAWGGRISALRTTLLRHGVHRPHQRAPIKDGACPHRPAMTRAPTGTAPHLGTKDGACPHRPAMISAEVVWPADGGALMRAVHTVAEFDRRTKAQKLRQAMVKALPQLNIKQNPLR